MCFFLKSWQKSTFLEILTKIENLINFEQNRDIRKKIINQDFPIKFWPILRYPTVLTKYQYFLKFWQEWRFSKYFYQNEHFRKFGPKFRFSENFDQKTKFGIFKNFEKISGFSKISIKLRIFWILNFEQNWVFFFKFPIKWRFIENFNQNRNFSKISTIIEIFRKYRPK